MNSRFGVLLGDADMDATTVPCLFMFRSVFGARVDAPSIMYFGNR